MAVKNIDIISKLEIDANFFINEQEYQTVGDRLNAVNNDELTYIGIWRPSANRTLIHVYRTISGIQMQGYFRVCDVKFNNQ